MLIADEVGLFGLQRMRKSYFPSRVRQKSSTSRTKLSSSRRWWREKDFSSVFNEKIITSDIDADSIVEMIYMDSANEG